jgi:hypothetical protein
LGELPGKGLKEGPYLFERKGIYYLTYPHVENKTERLEYATANSPLGPFKVTGVIMDESASGCWTDHHSLIEWKNQWYLFYHDKDYSPRFDKARSIRADSLFFNADGTIKKVIPTHRGIGVTKATAEIQVDRYSAISSEGAAVDFIDTADHFKGWKTIFSKQNAWIQYNSVDFGVKVPKKVAINAMSETGGILQIRTGSISGPLIAELAIPKSSGWAVAKAPVLTSLKNIQHLVVMLNDGNNVAVDWVRFE